MKNKNALITYLAYSLPAMPLALLGLPLYIYLPTFYANDLGLGVTLVGTLLLLARALDLVFDPLIGKLSDQYLSRNAFMLIGSLTLLCGFYALTHPSDTITWWWLLLFSMISYAGWSMISVAYYALSVEISKNETTNMHFATVREVASIIGVIIALVLPYAFDVSNQTKESLLLMFNTIIIMLPVVLLVFSITIKKPTKRISSTGLLVSLGYLYKEQENVKRLFSGYLLNNIANAIPASLFIFYVQLVLQDSEKTGLLLLLYFTAGIIALPLWNKLAQKVGKQTTWLYSMSLASAAFMVVPFLGSGDFVWFTMVTLVTGLSLGADMALPAAIQADIAKQQEKNETYITGALFGFWAMLTKLAHALAIGIAFGLLGLVGFDPKSPTPSTLMTLSLVYSFIPVTLKIAAILVISPFCQRIDKKTLQKNVLIP